MIDRITGVALRFTDFVTFSMPAPARHSDLIAAARANGRSVGEIAEAEQGFVTSKGFYLNRTNALTAAIATQQCRDPLTRNKLFSEDLW